LAKRVDKVLQQFIKNENINFGFVEFGHWIMLPWPKTLVQMKFSL
jgi:hypothetical protein